MVGDDAQNGAGKKKKKKKKKPTQRADGEEDEAVEPSKSAVDNEVLLKAK